MMCLLNVLKHTQGNIRLQKREQISPMFGTYPPKEKITNYVEILRYTTAMRMGRKYVPPSCLENAKPKTRRIQVAAAHY
jgi:hypothetical protein